MVPIMSFNKLCVIYIAALMFLLGLIDDIYSLSPFIRLIVQFIISIIIWLNNIGVLFRFFIGK